MLKQKIIQPLFFAFCLSAVLSTGLAAQITIISRSPAQGCAGTCDGAIRIKPIDDAAVPFEVSIKDANGNIQQVSNLRGEHEFSGLCAGVCEIRVTASSLQGCTVKVIQDYIQTTGGTTGGFQLELLKKVNESTRDFNDGSLSIKAIPAGNYTYLWSNGMMGAEIAGLTTGLYIVTATSAIGCRVIDSFALEACYDWVQDIDPFTNQPTSRLDYVGKYFEVDISGGALSPQTTVDTLRALVKEAGQSSFVLAPHSYQVKWISGEGDSLGIGPILLIKKEDASRYSPIKAVVSNGCETHEKSRTLILCGANNTPEVVDYFVDQVQARCVYGSRIISGGLISLAFPLTSTDPELNVSISHNGNPVTYNTDGGRSRATAWLTQLNPGTHSFQISMGTCVNTFSVNVGQSNATLGFRDYKDSCQYQLLCGGSPTGVYVNFPAINAQNWQPSGANECTSPIFCDYDNVYREVGKEKTGEIIKSKAGIYVALMESELRNPNTQFERNWIWNQIFRFEQIKPCITVKFCPVTKAVIDIGRPFIDLHGDSATISCGVIGGNSVIVIDCPGNPEKTRTEYNPDYPPNNCCGKQIQLPLKYLLESFRLYQAQIYQSKINTNFTGSELEQLLISLGQGNDSRVNCAAVTFCLPDYNVIKNTINSVKPCGETRVLLVDSTYLNNGNGTFGNHNNCEDLGAFDSALRNYYACLYTFDPNEFGHTFYVPPASPTAIPLNGKQEQKDAYQEFYRLLAFGETPNSYQSQQFKIFTDSSHQQELRSYLTISSEGYLSPKGLINNNGDYGFYNYSDFRRDIDIQDFNNVHLAHEDWDNDRSFYIGTHVSNKDLYLQFKDSIQTWTLGLKSDSSIQIQHLSTFNEIIQVGGIATSNLSIKGMEVFQQDSTHTAFLASFDFQGNLLKVHTIENVDTSARVVFSENRAGTIVLAGKSKQNWIKVDGDTVTFSSNQTGFIVKANELDSLQLLNKIDQLGAGKLRDISYAEGRNQFGLLVENVGNITPTGSIPVASSGNGVAILLFANNGNFTQSRHFSAQGLLLDQMDMTYGRNDGLIWGFSFSGSLNWGSQVFTSNGNEDIGLVKFDSNGDVEWHQSYGSQDRETVSHLLYENEVLYFGGQLRGNTQVRKIGSYYFINPTSFKNRTYISYVLDTLSTTTTELTSLKTEDVFKSNQPSRVDAQLKVYPNPFKSEVVLEFQSSQAMNVVVDIRNELGSQVKTLRQNTVVGFNQQKISTEDLPIGFYYLSLYTREGKLIGVQKLVKLE
jgi:Secretion system C-terminal sorting domain